MNVKVLEAREALREAIEIRRDALRGLDHDERRTAGECVGHAEDRLKAAIEEDARECAKVLYAELLVTLPPFLRPTTDLEEDAAIALIAKAFVARTT